MSEPNTDQTTYWNQTAGRTWAEAQEPLDRQLAPLGRAAMNALTAMPGERILDIGCGSGQTSLEIVGVGELGGEVIGIDLSAPLFSVAQRRKSRPKGLCFAQGVRKVLSIGPPQFESAFLRLC